MSLVLGIVAATMGGVLFWGLVAPRSNWQSLTGWSLSDPRTNEPGAFSYGLRRLVSAIGVLALVGVLIAASTTFVLNLPDAAPPRSAVHNMWGEPDPQVVNRVVQPLTAAPAGLPEMPIIGYQVFTNSGAPAYLSRLANYTLLGKTDMAGFIGNPPSVGFSAIDSASLVVSVRGPILCMPREAVVIETDKTIQIGIFYGVPDAADGSAVDQVKECPKDAALTASLLVPIALAGPVGDRELQALDGSKLVKVPVLTDDN
ncbi:MAG: fumarate hydratase [Rhodoglobus sp.]